MLAGLARVCARLSITFFPPALCRSQAEICSHAAKTGIYIENHLVPPRQGLLVETKFISSNMLVYNDVRFGFDNSCSFLMC